MRYQWVPMGTNGVSKAFYMLSSTLSMEFTTSDIVDFPIFQVLLFSCALSTAKCKFKL